MARTYADMVTLVRNWSNRDEEAVSDDIIKDALRYAADKAYKTLRIPPLESVAVYDRASCIAATTASNNIMASKTEIQLPYDLVEFIQIRERDANGQTTRVFNEKVDIRTFNDAFSGNYGGTSFWARERNKVYLSPGFNDGGSIGTPEDIELYYYRRLPALDATYAVTVLNYDAGFLQTSSSGVTGAAQLYFNSNTGTTAYATSAAAQAADTAGTVTSTYYIGDEVPNWLRDENERVLLFGALAEIFAFTQEDDQAQKYLTTFYAEIAELNDEDAKRNASGGNLQVNFNGRGLI